MNRIEAVNALREYDHCFINQETVEEITAPFGFKGYTYVARSNAGPDNPKGLTLSEGLDELRGQDAAVVATEICQHLKLDYMSKFGRGSQLRECCDVLSRYVAQNGIGETA